MEYLLECPICFLEEGEPKILTCGHSICLPCIHRMLKEHPGDSSIKCPICCIEVQIPQNGPGDLPTDRTKTQLNDVLMVKSNKIQCKTCPKDVAKLYCKNCKVGLCNECADQHPKRKLFTGHQLLPISIVQCEIHCEDFLYFCEDCIKLLCFTCVQVDICGQHNVKEICKIETNNRRHIEQVIQQLEQAIEENKGHHQPLIETVESLLDELSHEELKMKDHVKLLLKMLDEKASTLQAQFNSRRDDLDLLLKSLKNEDNLTELEKLQKAAKEARHGGIQQTLMSLGPIKGRIPTPPCKVDMKRVNLDIRFKPEHSLQIGCLSEESKVNHTFCFIFYNLIINMNSSL